MLCQSLVVPFMARIAIKAVDEIVRERLVIEEVVTDV
jgi:hypothetical protein